MKKLLFIQFILILGLQGCSKVLKNKISGKVYDAQNGAVIQGATVTLYEHHCDNCFDKMIATTTLSDGSFKIKERLRQDENYLLVTYKANVYSSNYYYFSEKDESLDNFEIKLHQ